MTLFEASVWNNRKLAFSYWIWHKAAVPIFIERFVLPAIVVIVIALMVTNPMNFDWTQRITGTLALVFFAYFLSHTLNLYNQRKPPLEQKEKGFEQPKQEIPPAEPAKPTAQAVTKAPRPKPHGEETGKTSEPPNPPFVGIGEVRDVPSNKIQAPSRFTVNVGNNDRIILKEQLARQVPLEELVGIAFRGKVPFSIWFDEQGALKVNTVIYSLEGTVLAEVKANEIEKFDSTLDRNWDSSALEIVSKDNQVLLQVDHSLRGLIRIRGMFISEPYFVVSVTDHGVIFGKVRLGEHGPEWAAPGGNEAPQKVQNTQPIKPLFRYPSNVYLHVRVGQNP